MGTAGSQLRVSLNKDVQGFQLLSTPTQVLYQNSRTAVLWEREVLEIHTVFRIMEAQRNDGVCERVGG